MAILRRPPIGGPHAKAQVAPALLYGIGPDGNPVPVKVDADGIIATSAELALGSGSSLELNTDVQGKTFTDASGDITEGGTAQQVLAADENRLFFEFFNFSDTDMYLEFGATATVDSIRVGKNGGYYGPRIAPTNAVSVLCATTGKRFVCKHVTT